MRMFSLGFIKGIRAPRSGSFDRYSVRHRDGTRVSYHRDATLGELVSGVLDHGPVVSVNRVDSHGRLTGV